MPIDWDLLDRRFEEHKNNTTKEDNMTDINERFAPKEKLPNITSLLKNQGDKVVGQIITDAQEVACHEFLGGRRGEAQYFQAGKVVLESALDKALPFNAVTQWVFDIQLKDGTRYTAWMDKQKKKALISAIKSGQKFAKGGMIAIEVSALEDSGTAIPRKLYTVQLKGPKGSE